MQRFKKVGHFLTVTKDGNLQFWSESFSLISSFKVSWAHMWSTDGVVREPLPSHCVQGGSLSGFVDEVVLTCSHTPGSRFWLHRGTTSLIVLLYQQDSTWCPFYVNAQQTPQIQFVQTKCHSGPPCSPGFSCAPTSVRGFCVGDQPPLPFFVAPTPSPNPADAILCLAQAGNHSGCEPSRWSLTAWLRTPVTTFQLCDLRPITIELSVPPFPHLSNRVVIPQG